MRPRIDINKLKHLPTAEELFVNEYGAKGTVSRDEFDTKSRAWYDKRISEAVGLKFALTN